MLIGNPLGEGAMLAIPATSSGEWRGNLDAHTGAACS